MVDISKESAYFSFLTGRDTYGHLTAVYLKNKIELANIAPDILGEAQRLSEELAEHPEEKVRSLASITRQFWHVLARQRKTATYENS